MFSESYEFRGLAVWQASLHDTGHVNLSLLSYSRLFKYKFQSLNIQYKPIYQHDTSSARYQFRDFAYMTSQYGTFPKIVIRIRINVLTLFSAKSVICIVYLIGWTLLPGPGNLENPDPDSLAQKSQSYVDYLDSVTQVKIKYPVLNWYVFFFFFSKLTFKNIFYTQFSNNLRS